MNRDFLKSVLAIYFRHTDAHHNALGYSAMAKAVYSVTKPVVKSKIAAGL